MPTPDGARPTYTFGDSQLAGDRLDLLASVFGPTTEALLREHAPRRPALAVDLGCGPGHTTRLVAAVTGATRTVGLDQSTAFVERARREGSPAVEFRRHDVTRTPFPSGPADLVFARYLLAHLPDPLGTATRWVTQLSPHGRLVVEEVEDIATSISTFARYLEIAVAMIASRGADMYAGRVLRDSTPADARRTVSRPAAIAPTTGVVARIFAMNLETWRDDAWVAANVDAAEIIDLERDLRALARRTATGEIVWTHRQVVCERA